MIERLTVFGLATVLLAASPQLASASPVAAAGSVVADDPVGAAAEPSILSDTGTRYLPDALQVVISLNQQRLRVYRGSTVIEESNISSGKRGYSTPTGVFSILHKKRRHFSNIYRGAPMPFMQRLTWTGIALHGSNSVPRHPASHGCVRLPRGFDKELFGLTQAGGHVVIAGDFAEPRPVAHSVLPQPTAAGYDAEMDHWRILLDRGHALDADPARLVSTAAMLAPLRGRFGTDAAGEAGEPPLRVLISRRTRSDISSDIQRLLNRLGFDAGVVDGTIGPDSRAAIRRFQAAHDMAETGTPDDPFIKALYRAAGLDAPQTGRIAIRRDFEPLFEASFALSEPDKPLGTHLLVTSRFDATAGSTQWNGFTLPNRIGPGNRALYGIDKEASDDVALADTLDRIDIPDWLAARIAMLLTPGSSILIADNRTERYTGWKTDFTVVTRESTSPPIRVAKRKKRKSRAQSSRRIATQVRAERRIQRRPLSTLPGVWISR